MNKRKAVTGAASSIPIGIGVGTAICILITLIGAAISAYLVYSESIQQESIGFASMTVLVLSSGLGALVSMHKIKRMRIQMCLLTGVCYYLALLAMTALFFGGQYSALGVTALAVLAGSGGAALLSMLTEKSKNNHGRKMAYR